MKKRTPDVYFACGCLWKTEADAKQAVILLKAEQGRLRDALEKIDEYMSACYNADHPANVMLKAALRGEGG